MSISLLMTSLIKTSNINFKLIFNIILGHYSLPIVMLKNHAILQHVGADFNKMEPEASAKQNFEYDLLMGQLFKVILGITTISFE